MKIKLIIWDNDGTIMGSKNPNDPTKVILPNVEKIMNLPGVINIICSGFKSPESEAQNFDPEIIIPKFAGIMEHLPLTAAAFSPYIGGVACFVVIKRADKLEVRKAHEDPRYEQYIGEFKKPGIGMLVVIKDLVKHDLGLNINNEEMLFIGDTWHDEEAAKLSNIRFLDAAQVHSFQGEVNILDSLLNEGIQK